MGLAAGIRIAQTNYFQTSLKKCACNNDKKYITNFHTFYANLIEREIVLKMTYFRFINYPDHFVKNKYQELESLRVYKKTNTRIL